MSILVRRPWCGGKLVHFSLSSISQMKHAVKFHLVLQGIFGPQGSNKGWHCLWWWGKDLSEESKGKNRADKNIPNTPDNTHLLSSLWVSLNFVQSAYKQSQDYPLIFSKMYTTCRSQNWWDYLRVLSFSLIHLIRINLPSASLTTSYRVSSTTTATEDSARSFADIIKILIQTL